MPAAGDRGDTTDEESPVRDDSSVSCNDGTGDDESSSSYTSTCTYKTCVGVCQCQLIQGQAPTFVYFLPRREWIQLPRCCCPSERCPYCRQWETLIPRDFPFMFQNRLVQFPVDSKTLPMEITVSVPSTRRADLVIKVRYHGHHQPRDRRSPLAKSMYAIGLAACPGWHFDVLC